VSTPFWNINKIYFTACFWGKPQSCSARELLFYNLAQLSQFDGEIAILQKFFLRSVSISPEMLENPAW